jgi:hypothetical protein
METDGTEFLYWLHKIRRESLEERKRLGISGVEWLKQVEERAAAVEKEIAELAAPVARDKPQTGN